MQIVAEGGTRRLGSGGPLVSIILPVKNRAGNLQRLLPRLFEQRCDADLQLIAVDSGSDDRTVPILCAAGATVFSVPPESFSYGLTRTEAARAAKGSILVFVTSTVLPLDDAWLGQLLAPFDDARVAGAFSRSIPRSDADLLTRRDYLRTDLTAYRTSEATVKGSSEVREITDWDRYRRLPPVELRRFISFSNNAAAIRAPVFRQIPFRDHHICEDMLWAQEALEAGHRIVYQRSSIVLYSHAYDLVDFFGRCFDGGVFFSHSGGRAADEDVVGNIVQMVLDDWRYLDVCGSSTADALDDLRAGSVLRRVAEMVGQWLGTRHDVLHDLDALRAMLGALPAAHGAAAAAAIDRGVASPASGMSVDEVERACRTAIAAAWRAIPEAETTARVDAAIGAALDAAAFAFGRTWKTLDAATLPQQLSLIDRLRRGGTTLEMRQERSAAVDEDGDAGWRRRVDGDALLNAIEALQTEYLAAHRELHLRAEAMARLDADVVARDGMIRSLQQEMHAKVAECNAIIAELQKAR